MVKVIVGLMGSSVAGGSVKMATAAQLQTFLDTCRQHGVVELDTARAYQSGRSEEQLGTADTSGFQIATKAPGFSGGSLTHDRILANARASLAALRRTAVDLYYFHGPDRTTPLEESCRAIGELHRAGRIRRFGVSNMRADEVERVVAICRRNAWVEPTVYQGGFNPLLRSAEEGLFPTLRRLGIAFYAYSPLGGGFFSRTTEELRTPPEGSRMHVMPVFGNIYVNELTLGLHERLTEACRDAGLTIKQATLRWFMHHSPLKDEDGVILGASSAEQIEENLRACQEGPLPQDVVESFEDLWKENLASGKAFPYHV